MASILVELYIWSMKNSVVIRDKDVGCHTYHDKGGINSQGYSEQKMQYTESRDLVWTPKNRRPEKLREVIKEAEDLLAANECVATRWKSRRQLQVLLKNCVLITFQVSSHSGDVERILVDKSLQGKLCSDSISHAYITDSYIACTFPDKSKLGLIYLNKKPPIGNDPNKKMDKLSSFDPKISYIDLPGSKARRPERYLTVNVNQEWIVVWWSISGQEALPWTPASNERDKANIVMFSVYGGKLEELSFIATDCDPVSVAFSRSQPRHIHTLEVSSQATDDISIDTCIYECSKSKIQRATVTTIPLKAAVTTFGRNHSDDKLVLGCEDGRLVLYDDHKRLTQFVQSALIPSLVQWHPGGSVLFVAGSGAEIQVFDMALNPLTILSVGEDPRPAQLLNLAAFFRLSVTVNTMEWSKPSSCQDFIVDAHDILMLLFDRGPVCMLQLHLGIKSRGRLGPKELMQHYLDHEQIDEAVNLLNALNWNTESTSCFSCISKVVNYLLRLPLNAQREAALESCLGSFYAPVRPISEVIVIEYRDPISRLARRFFHQLLRYKRFDKAFLLAVDMHARDLFMDIYYLAMDLDEHALATVAKQKADDIEREMPTSDIDNFDSVSDSCSSGSEFQEDNSQLNQEELRTGIAVPTRTGNQELKQRKQTRNGQWKKTEEEIDEAYQRSADPNDIVLDASRGLAGIPESVYSKVLIDNPFGWDKPDKTFNALQVLQMLSGSFSDYDDSDIDKDYEDTGESVGDVGDGQPPVIEVGQPPVLAEVEQPPVIEVGQPPVLAEVEQSPVIEEGEQPVNAEVGQPPIQDRGTRKTKSDPAAWKKNIRKQACVTGQAHTDSRGQQKAAKTPQPSNLQYLAQQTMKNRRRDEHDSTGDKTGGEEAGERQEEKSEESTAATLHVVHFGMV